MTNIVTTDYTIDKIAAPSLPLAPTEWDSRYQDQFSNVLRLYFNRLDDFIARLSTSGAPSANGSGLKFPSGSWYDVASQSAVDINTPYPVRFASTLAHNDIDLANYVTTFVGSIGPASTTLTVTSTSGVIEPGMVLTGNSVTAGTYIHKQLTGTAGSTGTYQVSISQTRASGTFTGTAANTVLTNVLAGYYNIQFSLQISKSSGGSAFAWVWPRVNGLDIPASNTKIAIQGTNAEVVAAWNFVLPLNAGDKFQLMWATDDVDVSIFQEASNAFSPAIPSAIVTATFVSALY